MMVITDADLAQIDLDHAAAALRQFVRQAAAGQTHSPPRSTVACDQDRLILTAGGNAAHFGTRLYTVRPGLSRNREDQAVLCWDRDTHDLIGVAIGDQLGAWRTGLLGGIAAAALTDPGGTCGIIGSGAQAATQARAVAALSRPDRFTVYSRDPARRADFAQSLTADTGIPCAALTDAEHLVRKADRLIVATNASRPVFDARWLTGCTHVTTLGPKTTTRHEAPANLADWADAVVTDSPQQIAAQGADHVFAGTGALDGMIHLGDALDTPDLRQRRTLFLSAGLSGTEVALLAALVNRRR